MFYFTYENDYLSVHRHISTIVPWVSVKSLFGSLEQMQHCHDHKGKHTNEHLLNNQAPPFSKKHAIKQNLINTSHHTTTRDSAEYTESWEGTITAVSVVFTGL